MNYILLDGIQKYLKSNGFTKEASDPNYICKFAKELVKSEKLKIDEVNIIKGAAESDWKDIALTGLASSLPGAALGYMSSNEAEDPWEKALQYGAITGLGGAGIKAGLPEMLQKQYEGLGSEWKSAIKGTALGGLPAGAVGYLTAGEEESPWYKALQYGSIGGGAGAVGGYAWDKLIEQPRTEKSVSNILGNNAEDIKNDPNLTDEQKNKGIIVNQSKFKPTELEYKDIVANNPNIKNSDKIETAFAATKLKEYGLEPKDYQNTTGRNFIDDINNYENFVQDIRTRDNDYNFDDKKEGFKYYLTPDIKDIKGNIISTGRDNAEMFFNNKEDFYNFYKNTANIKFGYGGPLGAWETFGKRLSPYNFETGKWQIPIVQSGQQDVPSFSTQDNFNLFMSKVNAVDPDKMSTLIKSHDFPTFLLNTKNTTSTQGYPVDVSKEHPLGKYRFIFDPTFVKHYNDRTPVVDSEFESYVKSLK